MFNHAQSLSPAVRWLVTKAILVLDVIDKHLAIYQLWKWEKDLFTTTDDKHEHASCIYQVATGQTEQLLSPLQK